MQTYAVHMRRPLTLLREIGWWPFFGLQILMGAMIASALVHPWFYLLLGYAWWGGELFGVASSGGARALWLLALANLVLGYVSIVLIGGVAVWRRGRGWLIPHLVLVPFYWLGISLAAYRALWELAVAPSYWAKTVHRSRGHVRGLVDDDPGCVAAFRAELSGDSVSELARLER